MRIEVSEEDIANGARGSYSSCPIARAVKRAVPYSECAVFLDCIAVLKLSTHEALAMSKPKWRVRRFIRRFERGRPVAPFAFDLDIPEAP